MPELPEVENVRRSLSRLVVGKRIETVETDWEKILEGGLAFFQTTLKGATITAVDRRGKYLLVRFDHDVTLVSHLRMEGKYQLVEDATVPKHRFVHVCFTFSDHTQLRYHDMRKFGRMVLVPTGAESQVGGLATIGPEPTEDDFTVADFMATLSRHQKPIKSVILDQETVAGVGNIYADESLWQARLHPEQPANTVSKIKARRLRDAIIAILQQSIDLGGTSVHTFVDANGARGGFQDQLNVYGRTGEPCLRCGTPIVKIKVGQRGTHYCPRCQRLQKRGA